MWPKTHTDGGPQSTDIQQHVHSKVFISITVYQVYRLGCVVTSKLVGVEELVERGHWKAKEKGGTFWNIIGHVDQDIPGEYER